MNRRRGWRSHRRRARGRLRFRRRTRVTPKCLATAGPFAAAVAILPRYGGAGGQARRRRGARRWRRRWGLHGRRGHGRRGHQPDQAADMDLPALMARRESWAHVGEEEVVRRWVRQPHHHWPPHTRHSRAYWRRRLMGITTITVEPTIHESHAIVELPARTPLGLPIPALSVHAAVFPQIATAQCSQVDAHRRTNVRLSLCLETPIEGRIRPDVPQHGPCRCCPIRENVFMCTELRRIHESAAAAAPVRGRMHNMS